MWKLLLFLPCGAKLIDAFRGTEKLFVRMPSKQRKTLSKFQSKGLCDRCDANAPTRLSQWETLCDDCCRGSGISFYSSQPDKELGVNRRFPLEHRGMKLCAFCKGGDDLTILYDETDDEWLFCTKCKRSKQLLRCWNRYTKKVVECLERPIVKVVNANTSTEVRRRANGHFRKPSDE